MGEKWMRDERTLKDVCVEAKLGPVWQSIAGNHCIPWQRKIAFSYEDPGDTLENYLNALKPSYSRKKSFAFQKKF